MCGIYGEFFNNTKLSTNESFKKQNDLNIKRGPNAEGFWSNKINCQLGFRRLSILDLSEKGNQPMVSMHGKYAMVFNGEIYNFTILKDELIDNGYHFNSTGDTEVLVNYFECFGIDKTLEIIDGMFAIALYSIDDGSLYLIRDFAGIKPLFYGVVKNDIVFGSRYDQISKHAIVEKNIDQKALKLYLKMHYMPAPFCILENTYQVEPGEYVKIDANGILEKKIYWEFPKVVESNLITDKNEAISLMDEQLEIAVKNQLVSDVPLGTFLSGGIDSPLITYLSKKNKDDIISFTIGSDSKTHDESEIAKEYATQIGCKFELKKMQSFDAKNILKECMVNLQEPFADFSLIPTFELTKNASKKFTVMLSGDGGDELFFGYERFQSVSKNKKWRFIPKPFRYLSYGIDKVLTKNKNINECSLSDSLSSSHQGLHSRSLTKDIDAIFPSLKEIKSYTLPFYQYSDLTDELTFLDNMRKAEYYGMMQKTLAKVDRMSMANSLEVRVPFLQKSFIEAALKIHPNLSFSKKNKKEILKDLLRFYLPNPPIDEVKRGFTIPLSKWLREDLKEVVGNSIFDAKFLTTFSINKNNLQKIWDSHQKGEKDYKWPIFTIYSLQQWHQNLIK